MNKTEVRCVAVDASPRDHIRNEAIRNVATVQPLIKHLMQKRLHKYGQLRCRGDSHMTRTLLDMEVEGGMSLSIY